MLPPSPVNEDERRRTPWRAALACALLGLVLRIAYFAAVAPPQETPGLARKYQACAANLLAGEGFFLQVGQAPVPYVDRIPGYVTLLAGLMLVAGSSAVALSVAHAALGALQAAAAAVAGSRVGGGRTAWVAGLLVAAWPPLWKSDLQLVETGVSGLALTALLAVVLGAGPARPRARAWLTAVLSAACLALRPDYLLVPPMVAAWQLLRGRRRALGAAALTLALAALPCFAWALRNGRVADGRFVSLGLGTNLLAAVGESVTTDRALFGDKAVATDEGEQGLYWPDPARRDRARTERALRLMREHPAAYLKGCVRRVAVTLSMHPGRLWPGPVAEDDIRAWRAAHPGRPRYEGLFAAVMAHVAAHPLSAAATFAWAPLALGLAAVGAWRLRRRWDLLLPLLVLPAHAVAVHVPLHAEPRYFFPFLPGLLVLAAVALVPLRGRPDEAPPEA